MLHAVGAKGCHRGGPARLAFHGVLPLADGVHELLGRRRINLTFRRVHAPD